MVCEIYPQESKDNNGFTPLIAATYSNEPKIIDFLIEKNGNLLEEDSNGMRALDHAINLETTNTLTKHGATYGSPIKALINALTFSYNEVVDYLLDYNHANIEDKDEKGQTALHVAAIYNKDKIDYLIGKGADVNAKDNSGNTPLITAAKEYSYAMTDVVTTLLNHNADLQAKDLDEMTALHWAAKQGLPGVVELLVEKKANAEAIDNSGKTPLDLAVERVDGDQSVVECLTKARQSG